MQVYPELMVLASQQHELKRLMSSELDFLALDLVQDCSKSGFWVVGPFWSYGHVVIEKIDRPWF